MTLLARLIHGYRNARPDNQCCGRTWLRRGQHLVFAHGEIVVGWL